MTAFEEVCREHRPDVILVGGDVNSTAAVALVAAKEGIALGHVESGLRSFDRTMPEEINRVVTDHLSTCLFTTEESANENLAREGIAPERVHLVGNCMVDTLLKHVRTAVERAPWTELGLEPGGLCAADPAPALERGRRRRSGDRHAGDLERLRRASRSSSRCIPGRGARLEGGGSRSANGIRLCEPLAVPGVSGL